MRYLVELVFGIGFFGLGAIALTFFLRFILLTWAVRLAGRIIQSILGFTKRLCLALIFIFGPALLGAFIIGFALESGANLTAGGGQCLRRSNTADSAGIPQLFRDCCLPCVAMEFTPETRQSIVAKA